MMNYSNRDFERFAISSGISSNKLNSYKNYINPTIIEEREMNMQAWDVFSRLMAERIIYLGDGIDSNVSNIITAQMLYLDSVSDDDITIFVNNIDIRKFGSQGQQRTASLSLKLAEISLFKNEIGETPVLLLDDVLSELDESRINKLIQISSNLQTIITCTDFDSDIKYNRIEIENGRVKNSNK